MLLSIIRSVVVFIMFVDMFVFNNLMYALNTESVCLNFGVLKEGNLVLIYLQDFTPQKYRSCIKIKSSLLFL